jgi:hypothetical protein
MSADFTPLAQAIKARISTSPSGHETAFFKPVNAAAPALHKRVGDTSSIASAPSAHTATNIELKRDGDRISQIRVHCRCGELIEIDCEY